MSDEEHLKRLAFWLRIARERSGKSQAGAARELGMSAASKSTVSDWENGVREPKLSQLRALARYYQVPLDLFVDPPATAFDDLDRMVGLAAAALEAEAEGWASERGSDPEDAGDGDDQPHTQSA
jgi:transcriptional regulator with XRE-family HTH domain